MYSPIIGRFLQRDTIGYYDSMNLFQYCFNNPVNWLDPWGLQGEEWWDNYWDSFWSGVYQDLQEGGERLNQPMCKRDMMDLAIGFVVPGGNSAKILRGAQKSLLKESKLLKYVDRLDELKIPPGKEPWWSKLWRSLTGEDLPETWLKIPGK